MDNIPLLYSKNFCEDLQLCLFTHAQYDIIGIQYTIHKTYIFDHYKVYKLASSWCKQNYINLRYTSF